MNSRVVAIIQARMGSTRFPGKMLTPLGDLTLLEWVLLRVKRAKLLDDIVLATSSLVRDDALEEIAVKHNVKVYRGDENDVLNRFVCAADYSDAQIVVRICADNPFIDPGEIDRLVAFYKNSGCDYACNHQDRLGSNYADGFGAEILGTKLLDSIAQMTLEKRHREHVTLFLWDNSVEYRLEAVKAPAELAFPAMRFDVDRPDDLLYLKNLVDLGVNISSSAEEIVEVARKRH